MKSRPIAWKKVTPVFAGLVVVGVACVLFPPIRLHSLDEVRARRQQESFQPREFAENFWESTLPQALDRAAAVEDLLDLIRVDPASAKERHGRTAELGNVYYYFVRGVGRVLSVDDEKVAISVSGDSRSKADLILITDNVFGNAIRNGTGLVDVNQFANSQDFNGISLELNRLAESRVLKPFRGEVSEGARVRFVGCAEIEDEERDLDPLKIVPVALEIER